MALADARLLGEQAGLEQRLADRLGERAVVAGEAAREVGELGVVAAPLAHPVEPLEDPPRDAAGGIGVVVRADDLARGGRGGVEEGEDGVLVLGERGRVGGAAAEPGDGLGDASGWATPIGARRSATSSSTTAGNASARARRRSIARDLLVEGERDELGLGGVARDLEREVVAGRAREHGARAADLDERARERGDEQPRALADGVGVGGEPGGDGRDGAQPGGRRGDRDGHGRARSPSA